MRRNPKKPIFTSPDVTVFAEDATPADTQTATPVTPSTAYSVPPAPVSTAPTAKELVEEHAPKSSYAIAAVLDGDPGAWGKLAALTAMRAVFIFPGMWVGAKLIAKDLHWGQILALSASTSVTISASMLLLYKMQQTSHPKLMAMDGIRHG